MVDTYERRDVSTVFLIGEDMESAFIIRIAELAESAGHHVRTLENAEQFLETYHGEFGCVFCGVRLTGMSGIELLRRLSERSWDIPVAMMSAGSDVATSVIALKSGAMDYIGQQTSEPVILDLIHDAVALHKHRREKRADAELLRSRLARLTPRERDVMRRVVEGWPNKAVAADLGVSTKTVEAHRSHVMKKMEARSLPDLVRMAIRSEGPS